jgi:hypothetical protein
MDEWLSVCAFPLTSKFTNMKERKEQENKKTEEKIPVKGSNSNKGDNLITANQQSEDPHSDRAAKTERSGAGQQQNNNNPIVS